MSDEVQPVVVVPVPPAVPLVHPTTVQVVSATIQNVVVSAILGLGWLEGKLDTTVAVAALLLVVGIDFANRKRLPGAGVAAFGATGVFTALGGFSGVALAVLAALGLASCASVQQLPAKVGYSLRALEATYEVFCVPAPVEGTKGFNECESAGTTLNEAVDYYTDFNNELKAADADAGK